VAGRFTTLAVFIDAQLLCGQAPTGDGSRLHVSGWYPAKLIGFSSSIGFVRSQACSIALKSRLSMHISFYKSKLRELGQRAMQLLIGGTLGFSAKTVLHIAESEDLSVSTSPDVALHLGLNHQF
jgi:hypothetical protein